MHTLSFDCMNRSMKEGSCEKYKGSKDLNCKILVLKGKKFKICVKGSIASSCKNSYFPLFYEPGKEIYLVISAQERLLRLGQYPG